VGRGGDAEALPVRRPGEGLRRAQHHPVRPPGGLDRRAVGGAAARRRGGAAARRERPVPRGQEQVGGGRDHRRVLGPFRRDRQR
jgi:hypothetical protein